MQYRVKVGRTFGAGREYGPGDSIELTESEAASFLDKLELVTDELPIEAPSVEAETQSSIPVAEIEGMKIEWAGALIEMGITDSDMLKRVANDDPDYILAIPRLGPAKLENLLTACP